MNPLLRTLRRYGTRAPTEAYIQDESGCWIWQGSKGGKYPRVHNPADQTVVRAHRHMYELVYGPLPPNMVLHHRCETPACVRPSHLLLVTPAEHIEIHRLLRRLRAEMQRSRAACVYPRVLRCEIVPASYRCPT
jgi:hypothetical protein